jgi:glucose/arabinose dehydrogenase
MNHKFLYLLPAYACIGLICGASSCASKKAKNTPDQTVTTSTETIQLPQPYETRSAVNFSKVVGWTNGSLPVAPKGFKVEKFADSLRSARWIYVLPNGDVLVSQANTEAKGAAKVGADIIGASNATHTTGSPNKITLLRDADKNGSYEMRTDFLTGLNKPFGMLLMGNSFYVAVTDGLWQFPYNTGDTKITAQGKRIVDLPAGGYNNHWTRNIITNPAGSKIYISVGSASNVAEHGLEAEIRRACILEINPDGTGERVYAGGLRNPVGMGWAPGSNVLWTAVNERDKLGDNLVPDYATGVKDGGFYGWPFAYFGQNADPRIEDKDKRPDLVSASIVPDVALGSHTASLGLAFYTGKTFPEKYWNGMFIGQHGSWNRKDLAGYKVVFVPFFNGRPSGPPEDFLTGFMADMGKSHVHGRPVGVTMMPDGSMLVADDASDIIWRVSFSE